MSKLMKGGVSKNVAFGKMSALATANKHRAEFDKKNGTNTFPKKVGSDVELRMKRRRLGLSKNKAPSRGNSRSKAPVKKYRVMSNRSSYSANDKPLTRAEAQRVYNRLGGKKQDLYIEVGKPVNFDSPEM